VKKEQQLAKDAQREQDFKWETMASGIQKPIAPLTTTTPTPAVDAPATTEKRLLTPAELAAKRALQE
jgi:hypothetical protein